MSFLSRLIENLSYVCFNNVVGLLYSLETLGQFNMAMRLIEPIRGAVVATGHNLAFSFFARAGHDPGRLRDLAGHVVAQAALVTAPVFVGLAAIATHILPVVAGSGWEPAAHIAICLSLGGALAVPAGLLFTAFSATGRPEMSVASLALGLVGIVAALVLLHPLGPISVGLSRLVGDAIRAGFAILAPSGALGWTRGARAGALRTAWVMSAAMGAIVASFSGVVDDMGPAFALAAMMGSGVVSYLALLAVGARDSFFALLAHLPRRGAGLQNGAR
jgi:O-antigen/teichoic acid export membrane protein